MTDKKNDEIDLKNTRGGYSCFSYRVEVYFLTITILLFVFGVFLLAFSNRFIPYLYDFFAHKVFHREFKIEKWLPTLQSFFMIPVFITIVFNAILFHKHSDKFKIFYLSTILICIAFFVAYVVAVSMPNFIDADLASETLLARECVREKSPVPLGWCYSTEIRLLNTQLISAPLFIFIKSWNLVRSLTSIISCGILFWTCWFLLSKVGIKKTWLKMLGSTLLVCPWSSLHFYVIGWGNYYIPHIVLGFLTLALFIPIMNGSAKNMKRRIFLFYVLAFISGLSTIRYILIYQFPLFVTMLIMSFPKEKITEPLSFAIIKKMIFERKPLVITFIALLFSGLGYVFNNVVLHSLYHFSQWNDVTFNFFGDVTIGTLLSTIIRSFGYQENVAVFTPGGVINIFVYFALALFIVCMVSSLKKNISLEKKLLMIFTLCTIGFNSFLYFHTEFIGRFYITILAYMIPCLIIFIDDAELSVFKRYGVGVFFSVCIFISSFTSVQNYLTSNPNKDIQPVMEFLSKKVAEDRDYSFGYSTFDFANMITYFTDEKIEVGSIKKQHRDGKDCLPYKYTPGTWLTPLRYNSYKTSGKVFFMTSQKIYENSIDNILFDTGTLIFNDNNYRVYEYANQEIFKNAFGKKNY